MRLMRLALLAAVVFCLPLAAVADVREAAQRAIRATVAVEFESHESAPPPVPYGAPAASDDGWRIRPNGAPPASGTDRPEREQPSPPPAVGPARPSPNSDGSTDDAAAGTLQQAYQKLLQSRAFADPPTIAEWQRAVQRANAAVATPRAAELTMTSGTVVSPDGLIVTFGLPSGQGRLKVTFSDGRQYTAVHAAKDQRTGLQLLQVEAADLERLAPAGQPAGLGDAVIAAYCMSERDRAIARGIVAATGRTLSGFSVGVLQTDAAVGRMSAGGPLVDENGSLVGIVAAMEDGDAPAVTLAVPAEHVRTLLDARRDDAFTVVERPWLGIQPVEQPEAGAVGIREVYANSPAEKAGLQSGDEIIAISGEVVHSPQDVVRLVGSRRVGDEIEITVQRDGQEQKVTVTLGYLQPAGPAAAAPQDPGWRVTLPAPGRILLYEPDGTLKSLPLPPGADPHAPFFPRTLRVERSDVEKKLDELSRDVRDLKTQIEELTRQLQRLTEKPDGGT